MMYASLSARGRRILAGSCDSRVKRGGEKEREETRGERRMKKTDGHLRSPRVIDIVGTQADRRVRAHFLFLHPGPFLPSFPFATHRSIRPSVPLSLISRELLARPNAARVAQSMCSRVGGLFVYGEKRDRVPVSVNRAKNYRDRDRPDAIEIVLLVQRRR